MSKKKVDEEVVDVLFERHDELFLPPKPEECENEEEALIDALFKIATGYDYEDRVTESSINYEGEVTHTDETVNHKHLPPDPQIAIYLLNLKDPSKYTKDLLAAKKFELQKEQLQHEWSAWED